MPINLTATDIVVLPLIVVGWASAASYCVVWFGTLAYFKAKERFLDSYQED